MIMGKAQSGNIIGKYRGDITIGFLDPEHRGNRGVF
jgi:hypothetical protein